MYIITFLGVDGVGKSTQISLLYNYLESQGKRVKIISFSSNKLRNIIVNSTHELQTINYSAENLAIALDIRTNVFPDLINSFDKYDFILFDRYLECRLAMADVHQDGNIQLLEKIYSVFPEPSVCLYFYADMDKVESNLLKKQEHEDINELREFHKCYAKRLVNTSLFLSLRIFFL